MSDYPDVDAHEELDQDQGQAIPDETQGAQPGSLASRKWSVGGAAAGILAYLHGAGAAHPQEVQQVAQQVDPNGEMTPDQRTQATIKAAGEQGGPDAAWRVLQAHRQQYNAKNAFAASALTGSAGKPPDLPAAVAAANDAFQHMPDGSTVQFAPSANGVTATVTGKNMSQSFTLDPEQFKKIVDVGGAGQFDNVFEHGGTAGILAKLGRPVQAPAMQESEKERPGAYDAGLVARSRRIFPWASQEQQRQQWLSQMESQQIERKNKVDVATAGFENKKEIAGIAAGAKKEVAGTQAGARVKASKIRNDGLTQLQRERLESQEKQGREKNATKIIAGQQFNEAATPLDKDTAAKRKAILDAGQPGARPQQGQQSGRVKMKLPDGRVVYVQQ